MSIRARGSDERRTPARKGPAAEIAGGARSRGGWGVRLTPAHCHSLKRMERYRKAPTARFALLSRLAGREPLPLWKSGLLPA